MWVAEGSPVDHMYRKCLRNRDMEFIDYNIVADFLIEMSRISSAYCVTVIVHYNLLPLLLDKIRYPRVFDLYLLILSPMHPEKNLNPDVSDSVWKAMKACDIFELMCNKMLLGQSGSESLHKTPVRAINKSSMKFGTSESRNPAFEPIPIMTEEDRVKGALLEEKIGLKFDIDGIMGVLDNQRQQHGRTRNVLDEVSKSGSTQRGFALNYNLHPTKGHNSAGLHSRHELRSVVSIAHLNNGGTLTLDQPLSKAVMLGKTAKNDKVFISKRKKFSKLIDPFLQKMVNYAKLESFYPFEKTTFDKSDIDFLVLDPEMSAQNMPFEATIIDLFKQLIIHLIFFNKKDGTSIPKFLEDKTLNVASLVSAMLDFGEGGIFKALLFDYLGKLVIQLLEATQPCIEAGKLVNRLVLLSEQPNGFIRAFNKIFSRILAANVEHICKYILNIAVLDDDSNPWLTRIKITYLETLLQTLYLTLRNDHRDGYQLMTNIEPMVWDCILDILVTCE